MSERASGYKRNLPGAKRRLTDFEAASTLARGVAADEDNGAQ